MQPNWPTAAALIAVTAFVGFLTYKGFSTTAITGAGIAGIAIMSQFKQLITFSAKDSSKGGDA